MKLLPVLFLLLTGTGCKRNKSIWKRLHLQGYDHKPPYIIHLPESVSQISGIVYYPGDSSIICVDDGIGILYKFPLFKRKWLQKWPFSVRTDHEALVLTGKTFYALQSNGIVETLQFSKDREPAIKAYRPLKLSANNEFEALIYDTERRQFLIVCKDCKYDAAGATTVWALDSASLHRQPEPAFRIRREQIEKLLAGKISRFKPSDAAVHPLTGDFYFISAVNDLLIVTDRNGVVKEAIALDRRLFKQPEGLAFTPNGTLLIANEAADVGTATIIAYRYNNPLKR